MVKYLKYIGKVINPPNFAKTIPKPYLPEFLMKMDDMVFKKIY